MLNSILKKTTNKNFQKKIISLSHKQQHHYSYSNNNHNNLKSIFSNNIISDSNNNNNIKLQNSRYFSSLRDKLINQDIDVKDVEKQEFIFKELAMMGDYETIISRYESLGYTMSSECAKYYLKALVYTNKIDKANLLPIQDQQQQQNSNITNTTGATTTTTGLSDIMIKFNNFQEVKNTIINQPIVPIFKLPYGAGGGGTMKLSWFDRLSPLLIIPILGGIVWYLLQDVSSETTTNTKPKLTSVQEYDNKDKDGNTSDNITTFEDVKGIQEVKEELKEIVDYLVNPDLYDKIGAKLPKGVLLSGEPGTGKTLLARAIAGEAGVSFLYTTGSSFDHKYVGVGAKAVRDLFERAREKQPCIIFIDEIDGVGKTRRPNNHNETLLQLLSEMDGFQQNSRIMIIGATNAPQSLDPALKRPGRFDRLISVPIPDVRGRTEIIDLYLNKIQYDRDQVKSESIARATPGFTGADLSNLINTAAIKAVQSGLSVVSMKHLEDAREDILMGRTRNNAAILTEETKRNTAYHEAGHALIAALSDSADPIYKATIIQRGDALGMVSQLPEIDHLQYTKKQMLSRLQICMGGRAAEEIFMGPDNITSGASSDFQQASNLAYSMISKWGMSDKIGFINNSNSNTKTSDHVQGQIDSEVKKLLDDSYQSAKDILITNKEKMEKLANELFTKETLTGEEILNILQVKGKTLPKMSGSGNINININNNNTNTNNSSDIKIPVS